MCKQTSDNKILKIGWLSSGMGEGSLRLFESVMKSIKSGYINTRIDYVFCNRGLKESEKTDSFLQIVRNYNIPLITFSSKNFKGNVLSYNRQIWDKMRVFKTDFLIAAGYKQIILEFFKTTAILNLHPALPNGPTGTWKTVITELIEENAKHSGLMINRVTKDVDRGPVLTYCKFPIPKLEFSAIRYEQLKREGIFMVETIKAITDKKIILSNTEALDISDLVDKKTR